MPLWCYVYFFVQKLQLKGFTGESHNLQKSHAFADNFSIVKYFFHFHKNINSNNGTEYEIRLV